jgi:hypothetical protein
MVGGWFDDLSRAYTVAGSRQGAFRGLLAAVTGGAAVPASVSDAAEAAETPKICQAKPIIECMAKVFKGGRKFFAKCDPICTVSAGPSLLKRVEACELCLRSASEALQTAARACHTKFCGAGALCMSGIDNTGKALTLEYCCPPKHKPIRATPRGPVTCAPGCGGLSCAPPHKLDAELCVCTCKAAPCPAGKSWDVKTCKCMERQAGAGGG